MRFTTILSFGITAVGAVLAAPIAQSQVQPASLADSKAKWSFSVYSVKGHIFRDRPIVALSESTINGVPQNHVPQTQVHLPATFGLENFTVNPPSKPVIFNLWTIGAPGDFRYSLASVNNNGTNGWDQDYVAEYILPAPNNFIATGWSTFPGDYDCPRDLRCNVLDWEINDQTKVFKPHGRAGAWDAVRTKEGHGWRVVWKDDVSTVQHEVQISIVQSNE